MPSNHFILCRTLLLLPSIFPSIRVFSKESVLCIRWPKYWSFSFSISPSSEYSGLISFRMDWLDLRAVKGTAISYKVIYITNLVQSRPWKETVSLVASVYPSFRTQHHSVRRPHFSLLGLTVESKRRKHILRSSSSTHHTEVSGQFQQYCQVPQLGAF